jgi:hypothetical protein
LGDRSDVSTSPAFLTDIDEALGIGESSYHIDLIIIGDQKWPHHYSSSTKRPETSSLRFGDDSAMDESLPGSKGL